MSHLWAVEWRSDNWLDGRTRHWMAKYFQHKRDPVYTGYCPALFATRREARAWVKEFHGYIAKRPDLRAEPHGWKPPKIYKVKVELIKQ